jgi:hypothetical protein
VSDTWLPSLFPPPPPQSQPSQSFTLEGKTARSGYGIIGRLYFKPVIQPVSQEWKKFGLWLPLGNPPDWPPNTTGTFTLSSKVNRVTNNHLGRISRTFYVTVPGFAEMWRADGTAECGFNVPSTVEGTFQADGSSACVFEGPPQPVIEWRCDGIGGGLWQLWVDSSHGFQADGSSGCTLFSSAGGGAGTVDGVLLMQGQGGAEFTVGLQQAPAGFRCDGTALCTFYGPYGTGEDCLTSKAVPGVGQMSNFVF